jgi:hypothetical protein
VLVPGGLGPLAGEGIVSTGWKLSDVEASYPTAEPRLRVARIGSLWYTIAQDEPGPEWWVTGQAHDSREAAERAVPGLVHTYFGAGPSYGDLAAEVARLRRTVELLNAYGEAALRDAWWPGNARVYLTDGRGEELEQLLESQP